MQTRALICLIGLLSLPACQRGDATQVQVSCLQGSPGHRICHEYSGLSDEMVASFRSGCRRDYGRVVSQCDLSANWVGTCISPEDGSGQIRWRQHHLVHPDRAIDYPLADLMRSCRYSDGKWQAPSSK